MIFIETGLPGTVVIEPERVVDERGFFARTCCRQEFAAHGLKSDWVQCSVSFNALKGTLRGMHYQAAPYEEAKLVRCTMGAVHDVVIDLRRDSPAFGQHVAVVLSAENRRLLYIPEGLANGFQTLEDSSEVFYQISQFYAPEYSRGVRWDDPAFGICWPQADRIILARDLAYPDFRRPARGVTGRGGA